MAKREKIISNLETLGFSLKESEIYYELVKVPNSNGSQIAKKLGYPRTSVYDLLTRLVNRGVILPSQIGEITSYVPVDFKVVLDTIKREVQQAAQSLEKDLKELDTGVTETQFYNLNSEEVIKEKIKHLLSNSQKEVYINTNMELDEYKKIFDDLKKRKVRVILFTFRDGKYEKYGIETYFRKGYSNKPEYVSVNKRILIVSDMREALVASNYGGVFSGTYSENRLLVNLVAEHIHNDIYLMKLENESHINVQKTMYLGTMQEIKE